jgi:hypothetical protein
MFSRGSKRGNSGYNLGVKKTSSMKHVGNKGIGSAGKLSFPQGSPNMANGLRNSSNDASMVYEPVKEHNFKAKKSSRQYLVEKPKKKDSEESEDYA